MSTSSTPPPTRPSAILEGIEAAHGVAGSPDGSRVYISNESESTLDVFDAKTYKLIKKVKLSGHPNNIAVAKDGRIVVAIARDPGALEIIDGKTLTSKVRHPDQRAPAQHLCDARQQIRDHGLDPHQHLHRGRPGEGRDRLGAQPRQGRAPDDDRGQSRRLDQARLHPGVRARRLPDRRLRGEEGSRQDRGSKLPNRPEFIEHRLDSPSHGIGVSPDQKTLWVTSIPQNAVFAYDLADLKLKGHVDLPTINVAGHKPIVRWRTG